MSVTLTPQAISKIKEIYSQDDSIADKALRIYVDSGGCCQGYSYGFKFDEPDKSDILHHYEGFKLIMDPESEKLISEATIDYKKELGQDGFAIQNPIMKKSCGCHDAEGN